MSSKMIVRWLAVALVASWIGGAFATPAGADNDRRNGQRGKQNKQEDRYDNKRDRRNDGRHNHRYFPLKWLLQEMQAQIALNTEAIAELQALTVDLGADVLSLQTIVADHEVRIVDNEASVLDLQTRMGAAESDLVRLEQLINGNSASIASIQNDIAVIYGRIDANRAEMLGLVADLNESLLDQQAQIADLRTGIASLEADIAAQIATLEAAVAAARADLQEQIDLTAADLAVTNFTITLLLADIQSLQGALAVLRGQFDDLSADSQAMQQAIATINGQIAALDTRLTALEGQVASLGTRVSALEISGNDVYSQQFFQGQAASAAAIAAWAAFRAALSGGYEEISISSSNGGQVECTDPAAATQICNALGDAVVGAPPQAFTCQSRTWRIGSCGADVELNAGGTICQCDSSATVRPGLAPGNPNWGGVGTLFGGVNGTNWGTCEAPSQVLTVVCGN